MEHLKVMFSPVAYLREEEARGIMLEVVKNVRDRDDYLRSVDRQYVLGSVFNMLVAAVTCLKHEGFHEEREWRVIYAPLRSPSDLMESSLEVVGGSPKWCTSCPSMRRFLMF